MNDQSVNTITFDGPYLDILLMKHQGLCCSQIVVKLVLRDLGRDNPDLVRSMAALCNGFYAGVTCGVLTGASCALSLALDGSRERERQDSEFPLLLAELWDWFSVKAEKEYGGINCDEILKASPDKRACSDLLLATMEKLQSILATVGGTGQ
ncbi:DVU_1555 family C-GCAxxG-C-C protein [Geobacter grbiciae]|uniref:DVU_1555 family C-GCAxxG-C-C protein n=1 Tax=Geobacter grbiciae TaxID=155042 RepID=UPI001C02B7BC|nr:DV_1555 family C-GCAxxG-C-C protein [Geobacter grbiciae]MBT1074444.1 C-GCAxxG-C-C family protein [Geobacter grbiciae]